jgi:DNA polymerase
MARLWIDLETFCETPIKVGTYAYAEKAEIMLLAWAWEDRPAGVWDLTADEHMPDALAEALLNPAVEVWAHNSMFDRTVMRAVMPFWTPPVERWRDTMVKALAHGLPGSLDMLCGILGVGADKAKKKDGKSLIQLFCKPLAANRKTRRATRETHPEQWARFVEYAAHDIEAMRAVDKRLPSWNFSGAELDLWHLDQKINDRGVAVDLELAHAAIATVQKAQAALAERTAEATSGTVQAATQRNALLGFIAAEYGVSMPDLRGSTVDSWLASADIPDEMRELLIMRSQASATSPAKYGALVRGANSDGRLCGTLQFCGAGRTGRWAGRLFQPQNLPRPTAKADVIEREIEAIKLGAVDLLTDDPITSASNAVRGCIVAPPGRKLVVADLANIEGRMVAWLAGETWKLAAFRAYDAKEGPDLYNLAYAKAFAVPPEIVTKDQRQIGKVMELMLGYEGGVGAFVTGAASYRIDLDAMAAAALPNIPADVLDEARSFMEWRAKDGDLGMSPEAFVACDALKRLWRRAHPQIVDLWRNTAGIACDATANPGVTFRYRGLAANRRGTWLRLRLPSGRMLCYPQPELKDGKLSYMGMNQYTRKWERISTYSGKLVENVTQAASRDVLASSLQPVEADGFSVVLTVHDEIITETPDDPAFSVARLAGHMASAPAWADGLPLAAAGFEAYRYRKE